MAIKVKIFEDPYSFGLEQKIENYTNNLSFDTKIIDIKYSLAYSSGNYSRIYSAMIVTERN
jgi:hypothetical protein